MSRGWSFRTLQTDVKKLCVSVPDEHLLWLLIAMVLVVKFCLTVAAYSSYLQCMELYPTCLRQTGTSVGFLIANALGALGPYIVYLVSQEPESVAYCVQQSFGARKQQKKCGVCFLITEMNVCTTYISNLLVTGLKTHS